LRHVLPRRREFERLATARAVGSQSVNFCRHAIAADVRDDLGAFVNLRMLIRHAVTCPSVR
jgi:hypothetical protein